MSRPSVSPRLLDRARRATASGPPTVLVLAPPADRSPTGRWIQDASATLAARPDTPLRLLVWDDGELPLVRSSATRVAMDLADDRLVDHLRRRHLGAVADRYKALRVRRWRAAGRRFDLAVVLEGAPDALLELVPPGVARATAPGTPDGRDEVEGRHSLRLPLLPAASGARAVAREQLAIPPDALVVAASGAGDWRGGVDQLLRTVAMVDAARPGLHLLWIGRRPFTSPTDELVRFERVRTGLAGRFHHREAFDCVDAADLFVGTAREGPPLDVALRAAARGIPAVAFQGSLPAELSTVMPTVAPGRAGALARQVVDLMDDTDTREAAGRRSHERHGLPAVLAHFGALRKAAA